MGIAETPAPLEVIDWLRARFTDALDRVRPTSVLDVGCGPGALLQHCAARGIKAHGIEPNGSLLSAARAAGLATSAATAESLPFADRSFDWVTMRHMAHHIPDEAPALAEALRVCRTGILVAEPWLDLDDPSQRVAHRFDQWLEQQTARCGGVHRTPRRPFELRNACPQIPIELTLEIHRRIEARPSGWLQEKAAPFMPLPEEAATSFAALEAEVEEAGITYNGTCILTVFRRGEDAPA